MFPVRARHFGGRGHHCEAVRWCRFRNLCATAILASLVAPTDDETSPDALARQHRREVRAFFARHPLATVEEASEALTLPCWNVERALAVLRGEPIPYRKKKPVPTESSRGAMVELNDAYERFKRERGL